ncbi:MAG: hypothetical protein WD623_05325 [Marinobacter sp.]|uniref:hypothetical protein n=1 Tax=Marinobacter sp. TaxID=50741 RepID=UPI00349FD4F5
MGCGQGRSSWKGFMVGNVGASMWLLSVVHRSFSTIYIIWNLGTIMSFALSNIFRGILFIQITLFITVPAHGDTEPRQGFEDYLSVSKVNDAESDVERDKKIAALVNIITEQGDKIDQLAEKVRYSNSTNGIDFAQWVGVLLACVAVIITVLGVVIAMFSFFGYRKIMSSAEDNAAEKAREVACDLIKSTINETTKLELIKLFESNKLDDFLMDAAGKVIYHGISRTHLDETNDDDNAEEEYKEL